jgi:hypothetical protein
MPEPRHRTPAQAEASRRNGARSKGPVTAAGKARASRNALKHGLAAQHHLVVAGEDPAELGELMARLLDELGAAGELETLLVRRLAVAFWKAERAERMETALVADAPGRRWDDRRRERVEIDPLTTIDLQRFHAARGYQAQQGREISRCLRELRALRRDDTLVEATDEPGPALENEPGTPANDDAAPALPDEPGCDPVDELAPAVRRELDALLAADDFPGLARLAATGALAPHGLGAADFASPAALGRAISRLAAAARADRTDPVQDGTNEPGSRAAVAALA